MPKNTMELMFNAKTGILLGEKPADSPDLDFSKFKFKTVEIDPVMEFYDGDYDTGKITSVDDKPVLNESIVNSQTELAIIDEYPIHKQLNILIDMVNKSDMPNTPEFTAMMEHIKENLEGGKKKKKVIFIYEVGQKAPNGEEMTVRRKYTFSTNPKSNMRPDVEAIIGRKLTAEEEGNFDIRELVDRACKVLVKHTPREEGGVWANVSQVLTSDNAAPF